MKGLKKKSNKLGNSDEIQVTHSTTKRISYFVALILVIGSSIGSGIFVKSGNVMLNTQNSIILSLLSWVIAAFAVIGMAIALADIARQAKKDERGLLSWTKYFNGIYLYKSAKNIYSFFVLPVKFFVLPVYFFLLLQSGLCYIGSYYDNGLVHLSTFGLNVLHIHWWVVFIVTIAIDLWFIIVNGVSIKIGSSLSKVFMFLKFIPIIFAFLIGFIVLGIEGHIPSDNTAWINPNSPLMTSNGPKTFAMFSPAIGVILSLASIFFAFDGFYVAAGVQNEMKEPKKISSVLLVGLLIITIVYLCIALSLTFGADNGQWSNVALFFVKHKVSWIYSIIAILIAIGIIGIINGYSMWCTRYYATLIESREIPFSRKLSKLNTKTHMWSGIIFLLVYSLFLTIVFLCVGSLAYHVNDETYPIVGNTTYTFEARVNNVYQFCNLISNWQTIITFTFLNITILAACKDKIQNKEYVGNNKTKLVIVWGIISAIIIAIALVFQIAQPFVNLGLAIDFNNSHPNAKVSLTSNICLIVVLFVLLIITFIPSIIEIKFKKVRDIYYLEDRIAHLEFKCQCLLEKKLGRPVNKHHHHVLKHHRILHH